MVNLCIGNGSFLGLSQRGDSIPKFFLGTAIFTVGQLQQNQFSISKNKPKKSGIIPKENYLSNDLGALTTMKSKPTFWTISEAAKQLGYKSRSQLYRLIEDGSLRDYVYQDMKGRTYLLAEPEGKRPLISWIKSITRWQSNGVFRGV